MKGNRINVTLKDDLYKKVAEDAKNLGDMPLAAMVSMIIAMYYSNQQIISTNQVVVATGPVAIQEEAKEETNQYESIDMDIEIDDID